MMSDKYKQGFTLVELMVTLSIAVLIMASVLFSYSKFNNDLALSSAVQEMSIAIRQAQVYGLSVREGLPGGSDFSSGYGIYFSLGSPQTYYIFMDKGPVPNGRFDGPASCAGGGDCVIETGILRNGINITSVCGTDFSNVTTCQPAGLTSVNITFLRPKTDAYIRFNNNTYGPTSALYKAGRIVLSSPQGKISTVVIENMGRISIQ